VLHATQIRKALIGWYGRVRRDLPWRRTRDPYRIWVSEIMLQQTRVASAVPYYERFLERFPDVPALARAAEPEVLAAWAGLGYYSRARNLHAAAQQVARAGAFPGEYAALRALPGVGDYTAAAVASIAFGLPHAALDGNALRVLARLANDAGDIKSATARARLAALADALLDRQRPGEFNQAVMELGATVCLPKEPDCPQCPIAAWCEARRHGTERALPVKSGAARPVRIELVFLVVRRQGTYLLWRRPDGSGRMAGFWELPEPAQLPQARVGARLGCFRHTITHHHYTVTVFEAARRSAPEGFEWVRESDLARIPLSTLARKGLALAARP
jgi:A/G-specific adenine glycosylase